MQQDVTHLLGEAVILSLLAGALIGPIIGTRAALLLVAFRFGLATLYFILCAGPCWLLVDDRTYFANQLRFHDAGYTLATLDGTKLHALLTSFGGLWNVVGIALFSGFGTGYSTNVLASVFFTIACLPFIHRGLRAAGVAAGSSRAFCLFFLVHPEIVSQSSFFDLRDSLIMLLTTAAVMSSISLAHTAEPRDGVIALLALFLLSLLRLYAAILLLLLAPIAWLMLRPPASPGRQRLRVVATLGSAALLAAFALLHYRGALAYLSLPSPAALVKFAVSPLVWNIASPWYGWAWAFSIFHLATLPLIPLGGWLLWRNYPPLRCLILVAAAYALLYSLIGFDEDYRLRYQIIVTYSLMQFLGLRALVHFARSGSFLSPRDAPPPRFAAPRRIA